MLGIDAPWCVFISSKRGLSFVAYPYQGAMREPECWDRRRETYSHVFFCTLSPRGSFHNQNVNRVTVSRGALTGGHRVCLPLCKTKYSSHQIIYFINILKFKRIMDMKELTINVTSALESATEASLEGEVRGT